jgi:hypothetical protein
MEAGLQMLLSYVYPDGKGTSIDEGEEIGELWSFHQQSMKKGKGTSVLSVANNNIYKETVQMTARWPNKDP